MKTSKIEDEHFMRLAIEQAKQGREKEGGAEVGCVIIHENESVAEAFNEVQFLCDPTAHAEVVALRRLGQKLKQVKFPGCTLYVTLQPCSMCASACVWAGINRIVFGAPRSDVHSMYFDAQHIDAEDLIADAFRLTIQICGGVLAAECSALYYKPSDSPPIGEQTNI